MAPCKGNVSANRMQNLKTRFQSFAEVQPDFAKQCQCKPNAERRELALKSYAEVQPDFAEGNVNANRMQSDGGFEPAAPCKGNGISAQGKVNEVNDTLGFPPTTAFKCYRAL